MAIVNNICNFHFKMFMLSHLFMIIWVNFLFLLYLTPSMHILQLYEWELLIYWLSELYFLFKTKHSCPILRIKKPLGVNVLKPDFTCTIIFADFYNYVSTSKRFCWSFEKSNTIGLLKVTYKPTGLCKNNT